MPDDKVVTDFGSRAGLPPFAVYPRRIAAILGNARESGRAGIEFASPTLALNRKARSFDG